MSTTPQQPTSSSTDPAPSSSSALPSPPPPVDAFAPRDASSPARKPLPVFPTTLLNTSIGYRPPRHVPVDHSQTPADEYDFNCLVPVPVLQTDRIRLEPLIPSIHGADLSAGELAWAEGLRGARDRCVWVIRDIDTGELAGHIGYDQISLKNRSLELAYVEVDPRFRRTHVQTHASYLLLKYALDPKEEGGLGLVRVLWYCDDFNERSEKAAIRLGFTREGILRWIYLMPVSAGEGKLAPGGKQVGNDCVYLSMTFEDWLQKGKRERLQGMLTR